MIEVAVIGGGAASFFYAINLAERFPNCKISIYEQGKHVLQKVKISGGGRCNFTHHCFLPDQLIENYPRGKQELLGPFSLFGPLETIDWFATHGVPHKVENDGRVFPKSNQSQSIIDCFLHACHRLNIAVHISKKLIDIQPIEQGKKGFTLQFTTQEHIHADYLFIGSGSSKSIWSILARLGHTIIDPVPSLFTFMVKDDRIHSLPGVSVQQAVLSIPQTDFWSQGPLLITHKGFSGPAVLKLSAFAARWFHQHQYKAPLQVNFCPSLSLDDLKSLRDKQGAKLIGQYKLPLPKRLQHNLLSYCGVSLQKKWASVSNKELEQLYTCLCAATFTIHGQNRFKEEFVTAGGVDLKEVHFKDFSSKCINNMFFAGEVLNIDAVTGGFNFQAAWTGAYLAANSATFTL